MGVEAGGVRVCLVVEYLLRNRESQWIFSCCILVGQMTVCGFWTPVDSLLMHGANDCVWISDPGSRAAPSNRNFRLRSLNTLMRMQKVENLSEKEEGVFVFVDFAFFVFVVFRTMTSTKHLFPERRGRSRVSGNFLLSAVHCPSARDAKR